MIDLTDNNEKERDDLERPVITRGKRSRLKGTVRTEDRTHKSEGDLYIPDLPGTELRQGLDHDAYARISWSNGYYNISYHLSLGGSAPCTGEDFWSGRAHQELTEHLASQARPLIQLLEEEWLKPRIEENRHRQDFGEEPDARDPNTIDGSMR